MGVHRPWSRRLALSAVLGWKLRRIGKRLRHPSTWDRRARVGILALLLVGATVASGWLWSAGLGLSWRVAGYNLLNLHFVTGTVLAVAVLGHALRRARRPRRTDLGADASSCSPAGSPSAALLAW